MDNLGLIRTSTGYRISKVSLSFCYVGAIFPKLTGTGVVPVFKKQYLLKGSVLDPDSHRSALILLSWIRIRIRIGNADPDPGNLPKLTIKSDSHPFKMAFLPT
jgi:hypothetical protein